MQIIAVHELIGYLTELFDEDELLRDVWVRGEVSNFVRSSAGHSYFTLKDSAGQLRCVLFRGAARGVAQLPANGEGILAHGRVTLYEPRGELQLVVDLVQPEGAGLLQLAFEETRRRLELEGLFQPARKRPLPSMPRLIGVVTSPTGAVWHDIQTVIARRWPLAELVLAPALVQGEGAAKSIAAGIQRLCDTEPVEVLIVGRGGGAAEDLAAFNDEGVARAIFGARVPVVSGVGHETDVTIADLVADVRAATPTAAAELCVPDRRDHLARVLDLRARLGALLAGRLQEGRQTLRRDELLLARMAPARLIERGRQRIDDLSRLALRSLAHQHELRRQETRRLTRQLAALSPYTVLARGYAVVEDAPSGRVIDAVGSVSAGQALRITVADGAFGATVNDGAATWRAVPTA